MSYNPYGLSNEKLLDRFSKTCAALGRGSICIDPMVSDNQSEANFLYSVLLSRLDGETPPFKKGDQGTVSVYPMSEKGVLTVSNIAYKGNKVWHLYFKEVDYNRYNSYSVEAKNFKKVEG